VSTDTHRHREPVDASVIGLRLVLAALRDDADAVNTISREAGACAGCWQQLALSLAFNHAAFLADHYRGRDAAAQATETALLGALDK